MYQIRYATEADMPELCEINYSSFKQYRFRSAVFPESDPPTLKRFKALNGMKQIANPEMHVVAVTDSTTGHILGYARWFIPEILGVPPHTCCLSEEGAAQAAAAESPLTHAPRPMNEGLFFAPRKLLAGTRKRHTMARDIVLDFLATLPSYRGRGIGSALLEWGIAIADTLHTRIYLEATHAGLPLYRKYGWKIVEQLVLDLESYGECGQEIFTLMLREPVSLDHSEPAKLLN
ncbi:hypothetical protein PDE_06054 [Penicillium oxalicum 114-2]|uniref:N-acetyltransferase domain-containing protein n=1 Tax=Penicillium oxalicum (strain 114-2 / CGMCC 5302) TaxID=933388 RepID=S7ZL98_PENO1|nr:hypothetical protein PDE_06054 [Penicillium oxalicum 114-2]